MSEPRRYGWLRDSLDKADHQLFAAPHTGVALPDIFDLRPAEPPGTYDQLDIGSCTGNQAAEAHRFAQKKQGAPLFDPSRLWIYYGARYIENSTQSDSGCSIRDAMKVLVKQGVPPEADWPYITAKYAERPSPKAFASAQLHQVLAYKSVRQTIEEIKACIASGWPIICGFSVYSNFESSTTARTGVLGMPSGQLLGGHATLLVGYNDRNQRVLAKNCWGPAWGVDGHFAMPYRYITDPQLASDFWSLQRVE